MTNNDRELEAVLEAAEDDFLNYLLVEYLENNDNDTQEDEDNV